MSRSRPSGVGRSWEQLAGMCTKQAWVAAGLLVSLCSACGKGASEEIRWFCEGEAQNVRSAAEALRQGRGTVVSLGDLADGGAMMAEYRIMGFCSLTRDGDQDELMRLRDAFGKASADFIRNIRNDLVSAGHAAGKMAELFEEVNKYPSK